MFFGPWQDGWVLECALLNCMIVIELFCYNSEKDTMEAVCIGDTPLKDVLWEMMLDEDSASLDEDSASPVEMHIGAFLTKSGMYTYQNDNTVCQHIFQKIGKGWEWTMMIDKPIICSGMMFLQKRCKITKIEAVGLDGLLFTTFEHRVLFTLVVPGEEEVTMTYIELKYIDVLCSIVAGTSDMLDKAKSTDYTFEDPNDPALLHIFIKVGDLWDWQLQAEEVSRVGYLYVKKDPVPQDINHI